MTNHNNQNHIEIEALIQKKLDREITPGEDKALNEHLAACPECRAFCRDMESVGSSVFSLIEFYPSHSFNQRVMTGLGFRRRLAWIKVMAGMGLAWFASALTLAVTPYPRILFGKLLASVPGLVRLADQCRLVIDAVGHFLAPLAKTGLNPWYAAVAALGTVVMLILFGTTLKNKKEDTCQAL